MKIKRFIEKYEFNYEDDIANEYAYMIISQYFDNLIDEKTLQESYDEHCEELEQEQRNFVIDSMNIIINSLKRDTKKIDNSDDHYIYLKTKKYNL